jgi:hypothetical protein
MRYGLKYLRPVWKNLAAHPGSAIQAITQTDREARNF